MPIEFTYFTEIFQTTDVFTAWIIPLLVIALSLLLITRDVNKWKIMAFPVMILWKIGGLRTSIVILMIAILVFIIEILSIQVLGKVWTTVTQSISDVMTDKDIRRARRRVRRRKVEELIGAGVSTKLIKGKDLSTMSAIERGRKSKVSKAKDEGINFDAFRGVPLVGSPKLGTYSTPEEWESALLRENDVMKERRSLEELKRALRKKKIKRARKRVSYKRY